MGKKSRAKNKKQDEGQIYMQRLQSNLEFFRKNRPHLYELLANMQLQRAELVVTPGAADVDMVVNGKSCYRGLAHEYSVDEAARVLVENPESKRLMTFAPPPLEKYQRENFADELIRQTIKVSPVSSDQPFRGYLRGNFFPSMVFLGCGLGYHIDALVKKVDIVNAIIIEREPEKFALTLYTVDWAYIFARFSRAGRSLTFAIGKADSDHEIRSLVHRHMARDIPFYPFFSTYYNHLADVELAKGVIAASKDLSVVTTNWSDYDSELLRFSNAAYNVASGMRFIDPSKIRSKQDAPMVVVGSGPSIDGRIETLKRVRDKVVIVSAGTGLGPLLAAGMEPDFHIELDPSYLIYRFLVELPDEQRRRIPLLAVNEVNPHVTELFDQVVHFFKSDNTIPHLVGTREASVAGCNPTVTNSALTIGHRLGFETIYLFGTDYGFADENNDHSSSSVYGLTSDSAHLDLFRKKVIERRRNRTLLELPSVKGGTVKTTGDYYAAKRSAEELLAALKSSDGRLSVYNCADGAVIEGAEWISGEAFLSRFAGTSERQAGVPWDDSAVCTLAEDSLQRCLPSIHQELEQLCHRYSRVLKESRLRGRKDLCEVVNQIRQQVGIVQPDRKGGQIRPEQLFCNQLLRGSLDHFLYVGLTHGMACEDSDLVAFATAWRENFLSLLSRIPEHFESVLMGDRVLEDDPWARRGLLAPDPFFADGP